MALVCNTCLTVCATLTRGRCPTCATEDENTRRPSGWRRYPRGYRANRAQLLAGQPVCHWCGAPADTADHVVARVDGGSHELENMVPSCSSCNSRRGQQQRG